MYAKLFASLYQGTLRGNTRCIVVFTNLLAHADLHGIVDIHPKAIADEVGLALSDVKAALEELEAPDEESRSQEENGRRIIRLDEHRVWGWKIVNHAKYRSIRNEEDRREQNRIAQAKWRERNAQSKQSKQRKSRKPESAHTDTDTDTDTEINTPPSEVAAPRRSAEQPTPPAHAFDGENASSLNGKSIVLLADTWELPTDWGNDAEKLGFKPAEVLLEAEKFRQYWTAGRGKGKRRSVKGWRQSWSTWLGRAAENGQ